MRLRRVMMENTKSGFLYNSNINYITFLTFTHRKTWHNLLSNLIYPILLKHKMNKKNLIYVFLSFRFIHFSFQTWNVECIFSITLSKMFHVNSKITWKDKPPQKASQCHVFPQSLVCSYRSSSSPPPAYQQIDHEWFEKNWFVKFHCKSDLSWKVWPLRLAKFTKWVAKYRETWTACL